MNVLQMMGETVGRAFANAVQAGDGSYIGVQTNQGSYNAGETIHGYVVAQLNSPRQVDRVFVVVTCKERTYWDEEVVRTISEGEGEQRKTRHVYEHFARSSRYSYMKEVIVASQLPHILNAGSYRCGSDERLRRGPRNPPPRMQPDDPAALMFTADR